MSNRDVPFQSGVKCDSCGVRGAYDFMGDYYCSDCAFPRGAQPSAAFRPPTPGPTDDECTELIYRITNERWDENAVKGWFADVTARIEREKGK